MKDYDVVVIGSGAGAIIVERTAAKYLAFILLDLMHLS